ncbi:hypothetical protein [Nocardioides ferulae]|uniref:hypothetical protein n=1 Tax=Nocardioides ferulae TaxID=2340821 RepID=UPI000EB3E780|nr:hypothetical protein [Nocardioides ferulae]
MKLAAPRRTRTLAAAGALLLLGSVTACGDDAGDAPESASKEDFCGAVAGVFSPDVEEDMNTEDQIKALKDAVENLADVGTPEGIADDARNGFELLVEITAEAEDDMSEDELDKLGEELSSDDEKDLEAFINYSMETCPDDIGAGFAPPEMPEDLESELGELGELESEGTAE